MFLRHWWLPILIVVAGSGLWLLLAGPSELLGVDTGNAGVVLLMAAAWASLHAISRTPRGELDAAISPGEWKAWIGAAFMAVAVVYFLARLHVFGDGAAWNNPDARAVGRNLVLLLVAWSILLQVMSSRWKDRVHEDERDREIARHASGWGRGALTVFLIGLAATLAFSPEDRLQWASHFMLANLMILALMVGCLFEYATSAMHYRRDRH